LDSVIVETLPSLVPRPPQFLHIMMIGLHQLGANVVLLR